MQIILSLWPTGFLFSSRKKPGEERIEWEKKKERVENFNQAVDYEITSRIWCWIPYQRNRKNRVESNGGFSTFGLFLFFSPQVSNDWPQIPPHQRENVGEMDHRLIIIVLF